MRIGAALTLIAIGAILKFAITVHNTHGFNVNTAGLILMIVGIIGLLAEMVFMSTRRRTNIVHEAPPVATRTEYSQPPNEHY